MISPYFPADGIKLAFLSLLKSWFVEKGVASLWWMALMRLWKASVPNFWPDLVCWGGIGVRKLMSLTSWSSNVPSASKGAISSLYKCEGFGINGIKDGLNGIKDEWNEWMNGSGGYFEFLEAVMSLLLCSKMLIPRFLPLLVCLLWCGAAVFARLIPPARTQN